MKEGCGDLKAILWKDVNVFGKLEGLSTNGKLSVVDQRKPVNQWEKALLAWQPKCQPMKIKSSG